LLDVQAKEAIIATAMALPPGSRLGPYETSSLLGAGGMGEVYRAKDTRLDRTVAIKVLHAHLSSDPELKQQPIARLPVDGTRSFTSLQNKSS